MNRADTDRAIVQKENNLPSNNENAESSKCCISSCELIALASAMSIAIAKCMDPDDITILSNFLGMLSSNLSTITDNNC